ncbi:gp53-like domain-containing protein [Achromobacter ruhlandii]|uniref:gp53-like domain-containing protein n=1 Tax=Achromobacter ruhlandii TaxID=72557 RepID=UPI003B9F8FF9
MATNELLQFATANTNILTQAEYAADAQRTSGNVPGVARSKLVNKAARQAAFVTAMIGQFIADKGGVDVLDDADIPGLVADFVLALNATSQGLISTTAQAQALTSDTTLLSPKKLDDAFMGPNQGFGTNTFWQKLPGGLLIQRGIIQNNSFADFAVTFPIAFVGNPPVVLGTSGGNITTLMGVMLDNSAGTILTQFSARFRNYNATQAAPFNLAWVAIGTWK